MSFFKSSKNLIEKIEQKKIMLGDTIKAEQIKKEFKEDLEKLIDSLSKKEAFLAEVKNGTNVDVKLSPIREKLIIVFSNDNIKDILNLNCNKFIKAAQIAFNADYFKVAHEILLFIKGDTSWEYIQCNSNVYAMAGDFPKAAEILSDAISKKRKSGTNYIKTIAQYGKLLTENMPVGKHYRVKYINDYFRLIGGILDGDDNLICTVSSYDTYDHFPIIYFYIGRCFEEHFNSDNVDENKNNAVGFFEKYINAVKNNNENEVKITIMETYWAMARIYRQQSYNSKNDLKRKSFKNKALSQYNKALKVIKGFPIFEELTKGYIEYFESTKTLSSEIAVEIMTSIEMQDIEKIYYHNELIRKRFIKEIYRFNDDIKMPYLHVLQRWNSFTPILTATTAPSRGGGYYINTGKRGIVIDPGFDFIKNFQEADFFLTDIDYIFISHAHNDHSADLESLTTLLHNYNTKEIKGDKYSYKKPNTIYQRILRKNPTIPEYQYNSKTGKDEGIASLVNAAYKHSPRRKKITIVMTLSVFRKYSFLDIKGASNFNIIPVNTSSKSDLHIKDIVSIPSVGVAGKPLWCRAIYAKHDDLISDAHCVGYAFQHEDNHLFYTGDTGYSDEIGNLYKDLKTRYVISGNKVILLAHIGGFQNEERYNLFTENKKIDGSAYYKNHLGRIGLAKLAEEVKPPLVIISEFGDEFRGTCRVDLADLYNKKFKTAGKKTTFIPADIGLKVQFDMKVHAIDNGYKKEGDIVTKNYIDHNETICIEDNNSLENPIYYFKKGEEKDSIKSIEEYEKSEAIRRHF